MLECKPHTRASSMQIMKKAIRIRIRGRGLQLRGYYIQEGEEWRWSRRWIRSRISNMVTKRLSAINHSFTNGGGCSEPAHKLNIPPHR